jgi:hypothetical protein
LRLPLSGRQVGGLFFQRVSEPAQLPGKTAAEKRLPNVRLWHKADIPVCSADVCFWGKADVTDSNIVAACALMRRRYAKTGGDFNRPLQYPKIRF